jgi:hypothetical protein
MSGRLNLGRRDQLGAAHVSCVQIQHSDAQLPRRLEAALWSGLDLQRRRFGKDQHGRSWYKSTAQHVDFVLYMPR